MTHLINNRTCGTVNKPLGEAIPDYDAFRRVRSPGESHRRGHRCCRASAICTKLRGTPTAK